MPVSSTLFITDPDLQTFSRGCFTEEHEEMQNQRHIPSSTFKMAF